MSTTFDSLLQHRAEIANGKYPSSRHFCVDHNDRRMQYAVYRWAFLHLDTYLDMAPSVHASWNELRESDDLLTKAISEIHLNGSLPKLAEVVMQKFLNISYLTDSSQVSNDYICTISELEKLLEVPEEHQYNNIISPRRVFPVRSRARSRDRDRRRHRSRSRSQSSSPSPDRSTRRRGAPRRPPNPEDQEKQKRIACHRSTFYILASLIKYYHIGIEKPQQMPKTSVGARQPNHFAYRCPDSVFKVIDWANMMTHGVDNDLKPATNLSADWNDGKRLFVLVKSFGLFTEDEVNSPSPEWDAVWVTRLAMNVATEYLEIPIAKDLLDIENFCVSVPLQEAVWMYLALFFGKKGSPAEKFVLNWVNQIIPNADVSGFSADLWNDGKYLYLLVDNLSQGQLTADMLPKYDGDVNSLAESSFCRLMVEDFVQTYLNEKLENELLFPMYLKVKIADSMPWNIECDSFTYMLYILAIKLNFEKADPSLTDLVRKQKPNSKEYFIESLNKRAGLMQEKTVKQNENGSGRTEELEKQLESSSALTAKQQEEIKQLKEEKHKLEENMVNQEQNLHKEIEGFKKQLESSSTIVTKQNQKIEQLNEEKHGLEEKMFNQEQNLHVSEIYEIMQAVAGLEPQSKTLGEELLIPDARLNEITSNNVGPTRTLYNVLRYWIVHERGTRSILVKAIGDMEMGEKLKRECIKKLNAIKPASHNYIIVLDKSVVTKVDELDKYDDLFSQVDWRVLGMLLGLDDETLEDIETSCMTDEDRQRTMVQRWIDTNHSYWYLLVKALENPLLKLKILATEIAKDNLIMSRDDNLTGVTTCPYSINNADKNKKKEEIENYLSKNLPNGQSRLSGVVFIIGMADAPGVKKDMPLVDEVFTTLNFTTMSVFDPTGSELALFVKAASEINFKRLSGGKCRHIVFHFSGHGRIDNQKRACIKGKDSDIPIQETIMSFFEDIPAGNESFVFFFDCCLSGAHTMTHISAPLRCFVAFATSVGSIAVGINAVGGRWTTHLCANIKENPTMELGQILARTHDDVVEESIKNLNDKNLKNEQDSKNPQAPFIESCAGPIKFKESIEYDKSAPVLKKYGEELQDLLGRALPKLQLAELVVKLHERNIIKKSFEIDEIKFPGRIYVARKLLQEFRKVDTQHLEDVCHIMKETHSSALSEVADNILEELPKADSAPECN